MAEIALGGIHLAVGTNRGRQPTKECPHTEKLSTLTAGIERMVCETCGHLSLRYLNALSGHVERERFARPVDRFQRDAHHDQQPADPTMPPTPETDVEHKTDTSETTTSLEVFARHERLHIRSRYESHPQTSVVLVGTA